MMIVNMNRIMKMLAAAITCRIILLKEREPPNQMVR
jgi:hypothetical protein